MNGLAFARLVEITLSSKGNLRVILIRFAQVRLPTAINRKKRFDFI